MIRFYYYAFIPVIDFQNIHGFDGIFRRYTIYVFRSYYRGPAHTQ